MDGIDGRGVAVALREVTSSMSGFVAIACREASAMPLL
jgi:hypothetical protein